MPLIVAHRLRRRVAPERYTDAPAFALREVDPSRIRESVLESAPGRPQWGRVVDGDWDGRTEPFDERPVPRGIRQRYREGRDWRDTALFDAFRDQLDRFGNAWGHVDAAAFDRRCEAIDRLHDAIRDRGYRRQEVLHGPDAYATTARLDEICVDIDRDGRLLWRTYGQHRLALAKLLGVDAVPVLVHRRHAGWQARREAVREGHPMPEVDRDHPDLRDLVERDGGTRPASRSRRIEEGESE